MPTQNNPTPDDFQGTISAEPVTSLTDEERDQLAEDALNAAALLIQNRLGVTDGGWASLFFSGGTTLECFRDYIDGELRNNEEDALPAPVGERFKDWHLDSRARIPARATELGFVDEAWHNDGSPKMERRFTDGTGLELWIGDDADVGQPEYFTLIAGYKESPTDEYVTYNDESLTLYHGHDLTECLNIAAAHIATKEGK